MQKITVTQDQASMTLQQPEQQSEGCASFDLRALLFKMEGAILEIYCAKIKNNTLTASMLGFKRTTLVEKLKRHGLTKDT